MIVNFEELPEVRERHAQERIVLAGGCFDLVHEGHVSGMNRCKSMGDVLVVGVSSDARIKQRKGPGRPIRNETSRLILVEALRPVDYAFLMPMPTEAETPTIQAIKMLRPDVFADHLENHDRWTPSRKSIESLGTELVFNDSERLDSTTEIIKRIISTAIDHA